MAGPIRLYFDAWDAADPTGDALGELTQARDKEFLEPVSGIGSGRFVINRNDAQAAWVGHGNVIRVRLEAGGPFDYDDARYIFAFLIEDADDAVVDPDEEAGEDWVRGGESIIAVGKRLIWWHESFLVANAVLVKDDHWLFPEGDELGHLLQRSINEWNARPTAPIPATLSKDFTGTVDSNGDPWETFDNGDYAVPFGTSYFASWYDLTALGVEIAMSPAYLMSAWNDGGRGTDRSATVAFRRGVNIREAGDRKITARPRGTRAMVAGRDQTFVEATYFGTVADETAGSRIGRREIFVQYDKTRNSTILQRAGNRALRRTRRLADGPPTFGITSYGTLADAEPVPARSDVLPYTDYFPGDTITVDVPGEYNNVAMRIAQLAITDGEAGEAEVVVTFEDAPYSGTGNPTAPAGGGSSGGGPGCNCPRLCHRTVGAVADEVLLFYTADGTGDDISWDGMLTGPPGAAGTTNNYFKSGSPDKYQTSWAVTPGQRIIVTGWIGCTTGSAPGNGFLTLNFFEEAAGTDGGALPAVPLEEHVLTPEQPAHEHTVVWDEDPSQHFSAGPFEVPEGAVSAALGRIVSAQFDEITISLAGSAIENALAGTEGTAARCDHKHHVLSDGEPTVDDDETLGYAEGTWWLQVDDVDAPTELVALFVLVDPTAGAAVWLPLPTGGGAGGGHEIQENGTPLTQRDGLNFVDGLLATDDAANNRTNVNIVDAYVAAIAETEAAAEVDAHETAEHGTNDRTRSLIATLDAGDDVLAVGSTAVIPVPFTGTITLARAMALQTGDLELDFWLDDGASYPPTDADTITGGNELIISGDDYVEDSTLTSWTVAVTAGDVIIVNVDLATSIRQVTVELRVLV